MEWWTKVKEKVKKGLYMMDRSNFVHQITLEDAVNGEYTEERLGSSLSTSLEILAIVSGALGIGVCLLLSLLVNVFFGGVYWMVYPILFIVVYSVFEVSMYRYVYYNQIVQLYFDAGKMNTKIKEIEKNRYEKIYLEICTISNTLVGLEYMEKYGELSTYWVVDDKGSLKELNNEEMSRYRKRGVLRGIQNFFIDFRIMNTLTFLLNKTD